MRLDEHAFSKKGGCSLLLLDDDHLLVMSGGPAAIKQIRLSCLVSRSLAPGTPRAPTTKEKSRRGAALLSAGASCCWLVSASCAD